MSTIVEVFWRQVKEIPERPAIMHKIAGQYRNIIWREHGRVVELTSGGLLNLGVKPKDKIAIMSQSRAQWTWSDIAILSSHAVTVPIYPTLARPEVEYLIKHSDAVGLFVENERQLKKVLEITDLGSLRFIVVFEGTPLRDGRARLLKWDDLLKDGEVFLLANPGKLETRIKAVQPQDLASIVYTSGTTGIPKGAMLLHSNFYAVCQAMSEMIGFKQNDISLSFLPLSHVYERVSGEFLAIFEGILMAYAESIETVPQNLLEVHPTVLNGVPRFYEKAYQRIQTEIRQMPKAQQYLIRWALSLGKRALKCKQLSRQDDLICKFYSGELRIADRLVYSKIRRRFGGRLRIMVSGAAPLSEEVQSFFEIIGLPMIEGYGLTETAAPVTCNTPAENRQGTVGRPLPGMEVKIANDGEILVKGPNVFAGYYKDTKATEEAFRDGWFLTGDIGELDADGYLKIKDRKKDLIITSGGKHVAPQFIENLFKGEGLISQVLVYGDKRKFISALITLNPDLLKVFAKVQAIDYNTIYELIRHEKVRREIEDIVKRKNEALAGFEQIKKFIILEDDFTVETNELTPTFKVKRQAIIAKYKSKLDELYDQDEIAGKSLSHQSPGPRLP